MDLKKIVLIVQIKLVKFFLYQNSNLKYSSLKIECCMTVFKICREGFWAHAEEHEDVREEARIAREAEIEDTEKLEAEARIIIEMTEKLDQWKAKL